MHGGPPTLLCKVGGDTMSETPFFFLTRSSETSTETEINLQTGFFPFSISPK
jgi:hypothetical protein